MGLNVQGFLWGEVPVKEHGVGVAMYSESHQTKIQTCHPVKEREEEAS